MAFALLWLTVFIMFFQPTVVFPVLIPYSPLKYTALLALFAYIVSDHQNKSDSRFLSEKINKYFLLFILMQVLSASRLWIVHGFEAANLWLRYGIVYFLIIKSAVTIERVRAITIAIVLAIAYLAYFSLSNFVMSYEPGMRAGGFGWYENSNDLAVILVSVIPLSYLLFETTSGILRKTFYFGLTVIFAFNILFTGSRNGLLGLFTVGMLSIILSNISKIIRLGLIIVLCASILGVGLVTVLARHDLNALSGDESSENRIEQWIASGKMLKAHPFFGVGPGEVPGRMRDFGGVPGLAPHNTILLAFAESGVLGGVFFLLFSLSPIISFFKNLKKYFSLKDQHIIFYKYFCVALMGFWVCAFFSNRVKGYQLYVLVALIVAILNIIKQKEDTFLTNFE